jgi:hypothetical protein
MFPHHDINKCIWTVTDRKTHNQTDQVLTAKRQHSTMLDVKSSGGND